MRNFLLRDESTFLKHIDYEQSKDAWKAASRQTADEI